MAFTSAVTGSTVFGNKRIVYGTYTSTGGSTGGDINCGIGIVEALTLTSKGSSVVADDVTVNETFPVAGSAVTIVTTADAVGYWMAIGS